MLDRPVQVLVARIRSRSFALSVKRPYQIALEKILQPNKRGEDRLTI
jgi:hypothetical protein